jgi:hypothetical protein
MEMAIGSCLVVRGCKQQHAQLLKVRKRRFRVAAEASHAHPRLAKWQSYCTEARRIVPVVESWLLHHSAACGVSEDRLLKCDTEECVTMQIACNVQALDKPAPVLGPPAHASEVSYQDAC